MTQGQRMTTPNGEGTYEGDMYVGAVKHLLIRHTIAKMASQDHGVCVTPQAKISGLWMYEESDVK